MAMGKRVADMKNAWRVMGIVLLVALAGCAGTPTAAVQVGGQPWDEQAVFDSDGAAVEALLAAAKAQDHAQVDKILGPVSKQLLSGDKVEDARGFEALGRIATEQNRLEKKDDSTSILHIGVKDWPFPIPVVKNAAGKWYFDTAAGKQEILTRRIGHNELAAINECKVYLQAQREYASVERDGSGVLKYAQHFLSTPGAQDGLYWETKPGEQQSPFGPMIAQASLEGYTFKKGSGRQPFHGYYYHILKKQGPAAPGGKYDYVINGNMIAGFALVAWPAQYGNSGVMTFIVNHQGKIYQKDLGPETSDAAKRITEYNPDASWTLVKE